MPHRRPSFSTIPLVDISPLRSDDAAAKANIIEALHVAARDVGFIYISGHGIEPTLIDGLKDAAKKLFALPLETKMDYYIGKSTNHRGYVPMGEEYYGGPAGGDLKEAFDTALDLPADDPDYLAGNRMLGPNVWPDEVAAERQQVKRYYDAAIALGKDLLRAFAVALKVPEDSFVQHVQKPTSQLRLIHYWETDKVVDPSEAESEQRMGIGAHTDFEVFTILLPTAPGLQVLNSAGDWIDAPPIEGAFIVNIGDMLETWSNGTYVATSHRVGKVSEERYSFPLFFATDYHTVVAPLPELVPEGTEPKYPPISAGEHLVAQTNHAFKYLKDVEQPDGALDPHQFGRFHLEKEAS